ncbi:sigma factor-like helix-turn-helix DNA-binding protein [Lentzea aerocolonigenes]|uniref:sigma factor-like helix-turn-helix DNA-binding protein n=1 Tax=Lentzea aerocolonigenes TaxID=68170 RepID=UPI0006972490|nr:sigma factor-like helix-turn-helix DNA-binding protein [Lentzea aerocolonigenes]
MDRTRETWLIADALSQLTREHREVITRACYRRETVAELADVLGLPQDAVKSRLHHGLRALDLALRANGVIACEDPAPTSARGPSHIREW